jgi:hypothetical protein
MTTGAVIFAFNNGDIDYVSMAVHCATRLQRHLDLPVTLISNTDQHDTVFDKVIVTPCDQAGSRYFSDLDKSVSWYNANRTDAYTLTPYDNTLVLDADYLVCSDQLRVLFDLDRDFLCHRWAYDVTGQSDYQGLNWFGRHRMPMSWATVMWFRKSTVTKLVFEMMDMVKQNWNHYRLIYGTGRSSYRNDHALTIALNTVGGHLGTHDSIPWQLANVDPVHQVQQISSDEFRIDFVTADKKKKYIITKDQDLHVMGKKQLEKIIANQG